MNDRFLRHPKNTGYVFCGEFGFYAEVVDGSKTGVEFDVWHITGEDDEGIYLDEDKFVNVRIKWDGCMNAWFGDPQETGGYIHFCDMPTVNIIPELFKQLRKTTKQIIETNHKGTVDYE